MMILLAVVILFLILFIARISLMQGGDLDDIVELNIPKEKWLPKRIEKEMKSLYINGTISEIIDAIKSKPYAKEIEGYENITYEQIPNLSSYEMLHNYRSIMNKLITIYTITKPQIRTNYKMKTKKLTTLPPEGVEKYDFNVNTEKIQKHIEYLFENYKKYGMELIKTTKGIDNLVILPETITSSSNEPTKYKQYFRESMQKLKTFDKYLYDVCWKIYNNLPHENKRCGFSITRHYTTKGIKMHIDTIGDKIGDIYSTNIGTDIYYDMAPLFIRNRKPVRIHIHNGETVRLTGDARIKWTHAIPDNIPHVPYRYAILFKFA